MTSDITCCQIYAPILAGIHQNGGADAAAEYHTSYRHDEIGQATSDDWVESVHHYNAADDAADPNANLAN